MDERARGDEERWELPCFFDLCVCHRILNSDFFDQTEAHPINGGVTSVAGACREIPMNWNRSVVLRHVCVHRSSIMRFTERKTCSKMNSIF